MTTPIPPTEGSKLCQIYSGYRGPARDTLAAQRKPRSVDLLTGEEVHITPMEVRKARLSQAIWGRK